MCEGYKVNKYGYGYCNHGFTAMSVCKRDNETDNIKPSCKREESFMSVLPDGFNIIEYRSKMETVNPIEQEGNK